MAAPPALWVAHGVPDQPPQPDFLSNGACSPDSDSTRCDDSILSAVDNARKVERVGPMGFSLAGYQGLSLNQQIFATANLERINRGVAPVEGLSAELDSIAFKAAEDDTDPLAAIGAALGGAGGPTIVGFGSNWSGGFVNALGSDYGWMYWDGPNGPNGACTYSGEAGCYGHRDNILRNWSTFGTCGAGQSNDVMMGVGYVGTSALAPSITELFVHACGPLRSSDEVTTWRQVEKPLLGHARTALSLSSRTVAYGDEQAERFSVHVAADYGGPVPSGIVDVRQSSTTLCVARLSSGNGSCTIGRARLVAGTYHPVADYPGDGNYVGSTSAAATLVVSRASSVTTVRLTTARVTFGNEQTENVAVTVRPRTGAGLVPAGGVAVKDGTRTLCTIRLRRGGGTCALRAAALPPGSYALVAAYRGSLNFARSTVRAPALTVKPATTTTALTLSPGVIDAGTSSDETFDVTVTPSYGAVPPGQVTVTEQGASGSVCTLALVAGSGSCQWSPSELSAGSYVFVASYSATTDFASSQGQTTLTVNKTT